MSDLLAARLLVAYHLEHQRPMMGAFLDALGIDHDNGLIRGGRAKAPEPAALDGRRSPLAAAYPKADVARYFWTLLWQDPDTWGGLPAGPSWPSSPSRGMAPFEKHVFVCTNRREAGHPRGSCDPTGGEALHKAFKQAIAERGLRRRIRANRSGCLDQCEHGPTVVVYPEAVWYGGVTLADVAEIVDQHLAGGSRSSVCASPTAASTPAPARTSRVRRHGLSRTPMDGLLTSDSLIALLTLTVARDRPRHRQRHLHLDPRRQAAARSSERAPAPRPAGWRWSCASCCCSRWPGSSGSPSRCSRCSAAAISGRDLILLVGGLFLIAKATHEIHDKLEGEEGERSARVAPSFGAVIVQIMLLDIVFSLDSVITAVGMADDLG